VSQSRRNKKETQFTPELAERWGNQRDWEEKVLPLPKKREGGTPQSHEGNFKEAIGEKITFGVVLVVKKKDIKPEKKVKPQ